MADTLNILLNNFFATVYAHYFVNCLALLIFWVSFITWVPFYMAPPTVVQLNRVKVKSDYCHKQYGNIIHNNSTHQSAPVDCVKFMVRSSYASAVLSPVRTSRVSGPDRRPGHTARSYRALVIAILSVRPSVRLSHTCLTVTKRKNALPIFWHHIKG